MTWQLHLLVAAANIAFALLAVERLRRARLTRLDDLGARERQALEIHDNVVQGLTAVTWALEAGAYDQAHEAARATLADAQEIVGGLLEQHPDGHAFGPGSLRRAAPPDEAVDQVQPDS